MKKEKQENKNKTIEIQVRNYINKEWKCNLIEKKVNIYGKNKSFDLVDEEKKYYGDVKVYKNTSSNNIPSAKRSTANEYAFLLQKIENAKKRFIVFAGEENMAFKYYNDFKVWLENPNDTIVEVYFFNTQKRAITKLE
jgi:hypothetical protein